jgi:hypothetical protein
MRNEDRWWTQSIGEEEPGYQEEGLTCLPATREGLQLQEG